MAGSRYQDLRLQHRITSWSYWEPEQPGESAVRNLIRFGTPWLRGDPRGWAAFRAANGERNDWYDRDDVVLVQPTARADVLFADIVLPPALPDGGTALGLRHDSGKAFARGAFPVRDVDDRKVGAIYVPSMPKNSTALATSTSATIAATA
jgi:hypothetical protein